ncbi:MAG: Holliday junction resolvase RecU [Anaeromassilibacillus sp.]|nr:Holliday junction resolvase RecU [Anaeromassilibacillus sp.]MDY3780533.1 Holliday junction resolvase RecU [Candidatus Limousia pullorum]
MNKSQIIGARLEESVRLVCELYRKRGVAVIDKTPEPIRQLGKMDKKGHFKACRDKKAQPDFKGVHMGMAICFDTKATESDRFQLSNVTPWQFEYLSDYRKSGGAAFILLKIKSEVFILDIKRVNNLTALGIKSVRPEDFTEDEKVDTSKGYVDFLGVL